MGHFGKEFITGKNGDTDNKKICLDDITYNKTYFKKIWKNPNILTCAD